LFCGFLFFFCGLLWVFRLLAGSRLYGWF
jgi:hypothetical protein